MSPVAELEDTGEDCAMDRSSQSSEDTRTTISGSSSSSWQRGSSSLVDGFSVIQQALQGASSPSVGANTSFSVINYVGKVQKQSTSHRSTVRSRTTPYERHTTTASSSRSSHLESLDETTSSSVASSLDGSNSLAGGEILDLDDNTRAAGDQQLVQQHQQQNLVRQQQPQNLHHGLRRHRSVSVSSSGCSSSMDDRIGELSPFGSNNSCRCASFSVSDFDDDGFREDVSLSSEYSVMSSTRAGYQPHHPLHHNHQNVPHHPNNSKGLFDIALKTVKLIQRNQELQLRLAQLQEETKAFVDSVMANPENESLRSQYQTTGSSNKSAVVVQK